jgi:hypothetical protein
MISAASLYSDTNLATMDCHQTSPSTDKDIQSSMVEQFHDFPCLAELDDLTGTEVHSQTDEHITSLPTPEQETQLAIHTAQNTHANSVTPEVQTVINARQHPSTASVSFAVDISMTQDPEPQGIKLLVIFINVS